MDLTILKKPEEILLALAKDELFENSPIRIENNKFKLPFLGFKIEGNFNKTIEDNHVTYLFTSKLGGAKVTISIVNVDEYSCKVKLNINNWGIIGKIIKNMIRDLFIDFVINLEFRKFTSLQKRLVVKMYTNSKGFINLLSKLSLDPSSYFFLIVDKKYVVEIVNGIELIGEEAKNLCKDMCFIELYELRPNGI